MTDYDELFADVADTLLAELGTEGEVVVTSDDYVPEDGVVVSNPGSPTSYPMKMAPPQDTMISVGAGQLVKATRVFFRMDDTSIVPDASKNSLRFGSEDYQVSSFDPVYSGALIVGWWAVLGA